MDKEESEELKRQKLAQTAIPIPINAPLPKVQRLEKSSLYIPAHMAHSICACVSCLGMQWRTKRDHVHIY